ncbi:hypothetical protein [Flavobacterium sp.]|uniref:hypothetical protein n=1 Tax=Flavobacterium sp. TaxID=239 RepID=UPI0031D6DFBB
MKKITLLAITICLTFTACTPEEYLKPKSPAVTQDDQSLKEEESKNLEKMYNEIVALSDSNAACSGDWDFIAIGKKPCGEPEKYIPYSLKINKTDFLAKVNSYNAKQETFNNKWNISSTCEVVPKPVAAACINGKATLLYQADQNIEKQELEKLYDEIIALSINNASCYGDWDFTAIGSKPCGGPEKYIPYFVKVNRTDDFFAKINMYKAKQMEFNRKWNISSTCDVVSEPIAAACIDEKPTLLYRADQKIEEQELQKLYNEIIALSDINKPCTGEWSFTAIGSKSCGGPEKYIPYSLNINTADFFAKINEYTMMQEMFNYKWKLYSTCDVPRRPKSVDCVDGKATFIYN